VTALRNIKTIKAVENGVMRGFALWKLQDEFV
jgi:hypothetical protein